MGKLSERITRNLVQNGNIQKEDEAVYQYALKSIGILGGNILLSLIIGIGMGVPAYCILFLGAIIPLRSDAGGYHAPDLPVCYLLSFASLLVTLFVVKGDMIRYPVVLAVFSFASAVCVFWFAPLESKGKPIRKKERPSIRKRARITVCVEWLTGALLLFANAKAAYTIWFAIIWCAAGYAGWFIERKMATGNRELEVK